MDNITRLAEAYGFGKNLIDEVTAEGGSVSVDIYKRQLQIADQIIDHFMKEARYE